MGALADRLVLVPVDDTDHPERLTARRRESNAEFGLNNGPTQHEIDLYVAAGRTPPTD